MEPTARTGHRDPWNEGKIVGQKAPCPHLHGSNLGRRQHAELAKKRAIAVRDALKTAGAAEDRIELKKPEQPNAGDAAEARRVEVSVQ